MLTLREVKDANRALGSHWFDADTMRFFNSRVSSRVYPLADGGTLFVSSERSPNGRRLFTVRHALSNGEIEETPAGFQAFASRNGAHGYAARLRKEWNA